MHERGVRRPILLLRDSGALQSLVLKERLAVGEYHDTLEHMRRPGAEFGGTERISQTKISE